ncbi:MAG: heparinase II/III family protein [Prolixibacteraceae bacterium]|nr:heparinase II/III family protein [Prolixibacteraceae bacterium]
MKKIVLLQLLLVCLFTAQAYEKRDLLQKKADLTSLKSSLILNQKWVSYPDYKDRNGWDQLTSGVKDEIISKGEAALNYEWKVVKATDYLEFDRSGSRRIMEVPMGANVTALSDLVLAELAEGKGRFMDQIANGIWHSCEMTSWALSAHIGREQQEKTALPSFKENIIDLTSGDVGAFLSWTWYFLKDELTKVQPLVSERLRKNLQERILDPYMNRSNFWWQAFNATPKTMVNNWNPWCNFDVLTSFLLLENDPDKLAAAVYRTMTSVDQFINYYHSDGACEEGPSYWGHAPGKLYDYLQILYTATGGEVSIFDQPIIKNMGEYIAKSYVGKGWVVNFADASAKGGGEPGMIFRYGKAVGSQEMQQFAAYLYERDGKVNHYNAGRDLFRTMENLKYQGELVRVKPAVSQAASTWYPETEFCYMRNPIGFFVAAKGGYNAESHNHNDMGSFALYLDETPMIIDAGVGTYTRQTFSDERYSIWTMQSNYHNLPLINGVAQVPGAEFRSRNVKFDPEKLIFSLDLAGAYPTDALVEKWQRTYQLQSKGGLVLEDEFKLTKATKPNQLNFLSWGKPDVSVSGIVSFEKEGVKLKLSYDAAQFEPSVEIVSLTDKRLADVWGNQVYRLSLNAKKLQLSGKYKITFSKN